MQQRTEESQMGITVKLREDHNALLDALTHRIGHENNELYPLVEIVITKAA